MDKIIEVQITFPNEQLAAEIGQLLVEEKLVACINIFPVRSIYSWQGQLINENECLASLKTSSFKLTALLQKVRTIHPYEVPGIWSWEINADPDYAAWINETLSDGTT